MIWALKGKVHKSFGNKLILKVSDIYFEIIIPFKYSFNKDDEVIIYTQLIFNENGFNIYGFLTESEKLWFNELIKISGIGPNVAINIISQIDLPEFQEAIIKEDIKHLMRIKGIGKKTAERIIIEMKDKVQEIPSETTKFTQDFIDALNVLLSLGIDYTNAKNSLISIIKEKGNLSAQELVKLALSKISNKF
ncbi:MAG: Holliday junction branch migration protein RuvA [candidate division WOR-3 bacterium]|jgi:Holliday junction DNA helicase RuvA